MERITGTDPAAAGITGTRPDESASPSGVSDAVKKRLPRYFRYLRELENAGVRRVSSKKLAELMGTTASQIRQDFNCFGGFGQQGYGYNVSYLYGKISSILGVTKGYRAVIVGCGNLGRALAGSPMFANRGVSLVGLFDISPEIIGKTVAGLEVAGMDRIAEFCREEQVDIAILTIPRDAAEDTAAMLAEIGVRGIWNFANAELKRLQPELKIENVHLGDSLMKLCYELGSDSGSKTEDET